MGRRRSLIVSSTSRLSVDDRQISKPSRQERDRRGCSIQQKRRSMAYRAWFQCIRPECSQAYPLNSIIYRCKQCGGLLEVRHDLKALSHRSGIAWMRLFEDRYRATEW